MIEIDARIRLVVLDWAGTAVDFGCLAPVEPFQIALANQGLSVSALEVRQPMGLPKKDHLRALLALPACVDQWRQIHGRDCSERDLDAIYADYVQLQLESTGRNADLIPGLLPAVSALRGRGIKIATTTGYFREAANIVFEAATRQGYGRDLDVLPDEVASGRPAPWMIFRAMEALGVYPPSSVLKVGDTPADIAEGRNAGCWSAGVLVGGSEIGLGADDWTALSFARQRARIASARQRLSASGAHALLESIADLPRIVAEIESRRFSGESPEDLH